MKRIQRKRCAGWRMPGNAIYVGRPSKWGNPYKMPKNCPQGDDFALKGILDLYEIHLLKILEGHPSFIDDLRGHDLACWCPLDKPCHADVILKIMEAKP